MSFNFWIPGELPSLNEYIDAERSNRYKAAKMKKDAEARIIASIFERKKGRPVFLNIPVKIHYTWVVKNRRKDRDNIAFAKKFIQDALVKAGIIPNDGWGTVTGFTDTFSVSIAPGVRVEVKEDKKEV